ncbi:MAG: hypothetical protein NVSMB26_22840 [Beijerinckiaceae bacterium]
MAGPSPAMTVEWQARVILVAHRCADPDQEDTGAERPNLKLKEPVARRRVCGDFWLVASRIFGGPVWL